MLSSTTTLLFVLVEHNTIPVEMIRAIILVSWTFFSMFSICYLGQMITNQFGRFDYALGQCNRYTFPLKIQQMISMFSSNAQQLTVVQGYGYKLDYNTFKGVLVLNAFRKFRIRYILMIAFLSFSDNSNQLLVFYIDPTVQSRCFHKRSKFSQFLRNADSRFSLRRSTISIQSQYFCL